MKIHQTLTVPGTPSRLRELVARIDQAMTPDAVWARSSRLEAWLRERGGADLLCYSRTSTLHPPAVLVWVSTDRDTFSVRNISPEKISEFTRDEYNETLREFHDRWVAPAARALGLAAELTPPEISIEALLGPMARARLDDFCASASRQAGRFPPLDRERWHAFLVAAHRERASLTVDQLTRWLHEEKGFPVDVARDLADSYDSARDLLAQYDSVAA
jgi:hypothetical protein